MSQAEQRQVSVSIPHITLLLVVLTLVGTLCVLFARDYVPLGEGPDELSHIDYTRFLIEEKVSDIDVRAGLSTPGKAPLGQGHQPPLSYLVGAQLLQAFYDTRALGKMPDYSAGITYSSAGRLFGGTSACSYGIDAEREDEETLSARAMLIFLRHWNTALLLLSVTLTYVAGRILFDPTVALAGSLIHASIPTAIYRSIFVSNDNLTATLCSLAFVLAGLVVLKRNINRLLPIAVALGLVCGAAFISKYNGVVTLAFAPLLLASIPITWRRWFGLNVLVLLSFSLTVFWDLYLNIRIDGDIFSGTVVREVVPFLYRPSSLSAVLSDPNFLFTVYERFWVNFHILGAGIGEGSLPVWMLPSWYGLSLLCGAGVVLRLGKGASVEDASVEDASVEGASVEDAWAGRILVLLGVLLSMLLLIVMFASKYPLPAGRYLHTIVTPLSLLLAVGVSSLFSLVKERRQAEVLSLALVLILFSANSAFSFTFLREEFRECKKEQLPHVHGGVEARLGDVDGDGDNDLLLFHRIRNRLFIARKDKGRYELKPEWSRLAGLVADEFEVGDLNGDGLGDPVFRRVGAFLWSAVDARSIIGDGPTRVVPFQSRFTSNSQSAVADVNRDGKADLILYFPDQGRWKIYHSIRLKERFRRSTSPQMLRAPKSGQMLLFHNGDTPYLGVYHPQDGELILRTLNDPTFLRLAFPKNLSWVTPFTYSDSGTSGFAWLKGNAFCLQELHSSMAAEEFTMGDRSCVELPYTESELSEVQILMDSVSTDSATLLAHERRDAKIKVLKLSSRDGEPSIRSYNSVHF
jgi:hypothetical protein